MKRLSELKSNTTCEVKLKFGDTLKDFLSNIGESVNYRQETTDMGTVIILDEDCILCTHEFHFDNEDKFLGFFTNCADGTNNSDNCLEIVYSDKSTFKDRISALCKLCDKFIRTDECLGGETGVHYSKLEAEDGNTYILLVTETCDREEIIAIIREDKLIEFGMVVEDVDIAHRIINN